MSPSKLALFPSFLALAALAVALQGPDAPPRPAAEGAAGLALDERLSALEARIDRIVTPPGQAPVPSARTPIEGDGARIDRFEERLQRLEARAWSIADLRAQGFRVLRLGHDEATLVAWTEEALDTDAPVEDRLAAFERLRGQVRDDTREARLAALEGMLALARTTDDARVRAAVYDRLAGLADPSLVAPLLASMSEDSAPEVRFAAARALAAFRSDEEVRTALQLVLEKDPDEHVKDAAFEALSGQPRRPVSG